MKRMMLVLLILLLSGCKSELVCTVSKIESNYESETKTVFEFNGNKIKNAYSINTMTFDTEQEAKIYLKMIQGLSEDYEIIEKNSKQIEIKISNNYEIYNNDKNLIIQELEKEGYSCE